MSKTHKIASGFFGDKLYQQRAREALPILVRQAKAATPIYYEDLATEMGMPNPRNLNYPLGCIGDALNELSKEWGRDIPHIQAIVRNRQTDLPGPGFDGFLEQQGHSWSSAQERRALIQTYWAAIANYPYWDQVLADLGLEPTPVSLDATIAAASKLGVGGEGEEHKALKEYVRDNPFVVGLGYGTAKGVAEFPLPSGDKVDVLFNREHLIFAVEVKPAHSSEADLTRGLFQCVKYQAVLVAKARYDHDRREIKVCLLLGGELPEKLIPLRNLLDVQVLENIRPE